MLLVIDANVLIDYVQIDSSILALASRYLGNIHVPSVILDEVDQLDDAECERLGLIVIEEPLDVLLAASELRGRLSFEDRVCLQLTQRENWTCVTNDKSLRNACKEEGVEVLWGMRLMLELVKGEHLERKAAIDIAWAIHAVNPKHITDKIVNEFKVKLSKL